MTWKTQILTDNNVSKIIFTKENAVAESVLYKYNSYSDRTVICCSTQSGCPVGCTFCGTGKRFIRNLDFSEITEQIDYVIDNIVLKEIQSTNEIKKFQIMFMSMGEPLLNFINVEKAIRILNKKYPNAQLLLSTVGINNKETLNSLLQLSLDIDKVGLQFSIHEAFDNKRDILIPYKNKMTLREIRDYGLLWNTLTNRPVYLNYCITGKNTSEQELSRLLDLFSPQHFNFTFSVVCNIDKNGMSCSIFDDLDYINHISNIFLQNGYNVRVFDPAGKDTIGGGCGQLWFVQDWMKNYKKTK